MDFTETYIKMCDQAVKQTNIGEKWKSLPQKMRLGTFICFRSVIGMVVNKEYGKPKNDLFYLIPETLAFRNWCDIESEDLKIIEKDKNFSDEGFPLFRQDQIQEMLEIEGIDEYCEANFNMFYEGGYEIEDKRPLWRFSNKERFSTPEQLWLAYYMHEKHNLIWDGEKWEKENK